MTEKRELIATLDVIDSTIQGCVKVMPKFTSGSSQHTLLTNRIKALKISQQLLTDKETASDFTKEELQAAQAPIHSLIHKSEKAMSKFKPGHPAYTRLNKLIQAMTLSDLAIEDALQNQITRVFRLD